MKGVIISHHHIDAVITSMLYARIVNIRLCYLLFFGVNPDLRAEDWRCYLEEGRGQTFFYDENALVVFSCLDLGANELDFLYDADFKCNVVIIGNSEDDHLCMSDYDAPFSRVYKLDQECTTAESMYKTYLTDSGGRRRQPYKYPFWVKLAKDAGEGKNNSVIHGWKTLFYLAGTRMAPHEVRALLPKMRNDTPIGLFKSSEAQYILHYDYHNDGSLSRNNTMYKQRR